MPHQCADVGAIILVSLAVVVKDNSGQVTAMNIADAGDSYLVEFAAKYSTTSSDVEQDDIDEIAEMLEPNTAAGYLVVEQLWAKPLKQAILKANGFLIGEGRIHPDAAAELDSNGGQ